MPFVLFFFLISLPVLEVASIMEVSRWVGPVVTFLLLAASLTLGLVLLRSQSVAVGRRVMEAMRAGTPPEQPLLESATVMFAGILFMIPGFVTDAVALVLLIPAMRRLVWRQLSAGVRTRTSTRGTEPEAGDRPPAGEDVIDAEYTEVTPGSPPPPGGHQSASPWRAAPH